MDTFILDVSSLISNQILITLCPLSFVPVAFFLNYFSYNKNLDLNKMPSEVDL